MKALDTAVLLGLLEGDRAARETVRKLRGHELATTEANLLELALLSAKGPGGARSSRREAIARLRRKMTVLPIDSRAIEEIARRSGRPELAGLSPHVLAMLGALEAGGCEELISGEASFPGKWRFRTTRMPSSTRKAR